MTGIFERTGHDIWQTSSIPKYAHELEHPIEIEDISLRNDADIDPAAVNVKSNTKASAKEIRPFCENIKITKYLATYNRRFSRLPGGKTDD